MQPSECCLLCHPLPSQSCCAQGCLCEAPQQLPPWLVGDWGTRPTPTSPWSGECFHFCKTKTRCVEVVWIHVPQLAHLQGEVKGAGPGQGLTFSPQKKKHLRLAVPPSPLLAQGLGPTTMMDWMNLVERMPHDRTAQWLNVVVALSSRAVDGVCRAAWRRGSGASCCQD